MGKLAFKYGFTETLKNRGGFGTWLEDAMKSFTNTIENQLHEKTSENYIYSPISVYTMLAGIYAGTDINSKSFNQIWEVLGYPTTDTKKFSENYKNKFSESTSLGQRLKQYIQHKYELNADYTKFLDTMGYVGDDELS